VQRSVLLGMQRGLPHRVKDVSKECLVRKGKRLAGRRRRRHRLVVDLVVARHLHEPANLRVDEAVVEDPGGDFGPVAARLASNRDAQLEVDVWRKRSKRFFHELGKVGTGHGLLLVACAEEKAAQLGVARRRVTLVENIEAFERAVRKHVEHVQSQRVCVEVKPRK
jgi:hypothetical protein